MHTQTFFRKLERLTVEGDVHLNAFAFLWAHCQALKHLRIGRHWAANACHQLNYVASGLVIADEMTNENVIIIDVFTALFRVGQCASHMISFSKHSRRVFTISFVQLNKMLLLEELHIRSLKVKMISQSIITIGM